MIPLSTLKTLSNTLQSLPGVGNELRTQILALVHTQLQKLDLVTRDEFEAQRISLQKSRETIVELEKRIFELEQKIDAK